MLMPAIDHLDVWVSARKTRKKSGRGAKSAQKDYGIRSLRNLILNLALSGRLTTQTEISAKSDLSKLLGLKPHDIVECEGIPENWFACRLDSISEIIRGVTYTKSDASKILSSGTISLLRGGNIQSSIVLDDLVYLKPTLASEKQMLKFGDFLIAMSSGSPSLVGKAAFFDKEVEATFGAFCAVVRPAEVKLTEYLRVYFQSPKYRDQTLAQGKGIGIQNLNKTKLSEISVPLPPLEEQKLIVAKVDELMRLIDDLEAQTETARESHGELVDALLRTLVESENANDLSENWNVLSAHFEKLFTTEESVEKLKAAILNLAVRGKVSNQNPSDSDASELIKQLRAVRKTKENAKIVKRAKLHDLGGVFPHKIPKGWAWATFPEIGMFERGKSKHRPRNARKLFNPGIYPLVQTGEVARAGKYVEEAHSYYSEFGLAQSRLWPKGTLCITIAANIADSAILGLDACFPDSVVGFIPFSPITDVSYFLYFMKTAKNDLLKYAPSTAQKNINLGILGQLAVPLPPIEEQKRIVTMVDKLMDFCDNLIANIRTSEALKVELSESVVYHVSAP